MNHGIALDELASLMDDDTTFDAVKCCQRRGISLGIWCTPTFFLNGALMTKVTGNDDPSTWIEYLESIVE